MNSLLNSNFESISLFCQANTRLDTLSCLAWKGDTLLRMKATKSGIIICANDSNLPFYSNQGNELSTVSDLFNDILYACAC